MKHLMTDMTVAGGFSLLEVTVAIAILAGLLLSVARIVSHSYYYTERVADIYLGTELARLKLHDIEEDIKKDGLPTADKEDEGDFDEKAYEGFKWKYSIKRVHIPIPDISGGSATNEVEASAQEQGADLLMGAKSMIEDFIKEKIRKLTLEVWWGEGKRESERVTFVLFIPADTTVKDFEQGGQLPANPQNQGGKKQNWFNNPATNTAPGAPGAPAWGNPAGRGTMNIPVSGGK
ncbi:MAG TPA: prepilin-type N-terminal cleavage/methylation domain-containing protein [bacterium]|nr:prepilin-type N-terminal cleavage/methylation domain-containing protein [bacterium]